MVLPTTTVMWSLDGVVPPGDTTPAITIEGDPNFCQQTVQALQTIAGYPTGWLLLRLLLNRIQPNAKIARIVKIRYKNAGSSLCAAWSFGGARTLLSRAMVDWESVLVANTIRHTLIMAGHDCAWFADQLCLTPAYILEGAPRNVSCGLRITGKHVQDWLSYRVRFPYPFEGNDQLVLKNSVKLVLNRLLPLTPGCGSSSTVLWNQQPTITLTDGTVQNRPAWLGLAHELIHAYYNINGTQLVEVDNDDSSRASWTVVFGEYMCVGLGPWANAQITENRIRAEAHQPLRVMY